MVVLNLKNDLTRLLLHYVLLHNKCILVWEGSGYPRNRTSMGMSTSVLAYLAMKRVLQVIARLKFIL